MRWFKHLSRAHLDEAMTELIHDCGHEVYGFYWHLLEVVAETMDSTDTCSVTHPLPLWSRLLYCHHHRVSKHLGKLQVTGLVEVEYVEGKVRVTIPNLLKYRDEYSKKSGHTPNGGPESVGSKKERQKEIEKEKESKQSAPDGADFSLTPTGIGPHVTISRSKVETAVVHSKKGLRIIEVSEFDAWFEREFWPSYPKKVGKAAARVAAKRKMTSAALMDRALAAIRAQAPTVEDPRFFPHAATWFNQQRWEDEVYEPVRQQTKQERTMRAFEESMAYEADVERRLAGQKEIAG